MMGAVGAHDPDASGHSVIDARASGEVMRATRASQDMTRSDLVEQLAERFGQLTQRDADSAVKTILEAMGDSLVRGHRIEIRGFGSFSVTHRPPRMGRNPRTGEAMEIPPRPARTTIRLRALKGLKGMIEGS